MKHLSRPALLSILFWPLTALVLFCDSQFVARSFPQGQAVSLLLAFAFLTALCFCIDPKHRLVLVLFVFLSAIGEGIFSLLFGLYRYRLGGVPLYVPLGHSILTGTGLLMVQSAWVTQRRKMVQAALLLLHGGLVAGSLLFCGDTLSLFWAAIFLLLLRARIADPFYLILGALVLYVEMLGTTWGCWTWQPTAFGILKTVNPPPGAFTCYVVGDALAIIIATAIAALWSRWKIYRLEPITP